jgi:predicted esterase
METDPAFIHRFEPASDQSTGRTLILLHGTGGDENDMIVLGRQLDPAAALLSPRGQVKEEGRNRFFRRLREGVFDEADVVRRAGELAEFCTAAAHRYHFDLARAVAVGYSNGANIAAAMLLLGLAEFRGAILFRAMVPLIPKQPSSLLGRRALISTGEHDPLVAMEDAQQLVGLLQAAQCDVEFHLEEGGHELRAGDLRAARQWLR